MRKFHLKQHLQKASKLMLLWFFSVFTLVFTLISTIGILKMVSFDAPLKNQENKSVSFSFFLFLEFDFE